MEICYLFQNKSKTGLKKRLLATVGLNCETTKPSSQGSHVIPKCGMGSDIQLH